MLRRLTLVILTSLLFAACSSSTDPGNDDDGGGNSQTDYHGYFLDDAVRGLEYQVGTAAVQTTDEYGTFTFALNEGITFRVDGVTLGSVTDGLTRITPVNLGASGINIARFLQSLDTTPGIPGIDLRGVDLAATPIDFTQGGSEFGADPAVLAAVAAAATVGGSGVLVSAAAATAELNAGTSTVLTLADLENVALFPVNPGPVNEPCFVRFRDDGTGQCVCQDNIDADPSGAAAEFTWSIQNSQAIVEFDFGSGVEERVTVQQLGTTGNRVSAQVTSEQLMCNPNVQRCIEASVQTLIKALPISTPDFSNKSVTLSAAFGSGTATFNANGTGALTIGGGTESFQWAVGSTFDNVLLLQGTGSPGDVMLFHELILINGTADNGTFVGLFAEATDSNNNGLVEPFEMIATGQYQAVDLMTTTSTAAR